MPPSYPCSSRSRSKIRFEVCCCLAGCPLSSSRIRSMIPTNGSSFGRAGGRPRRYPGGTENASIFATVRGSIPNRRAASRRLSPSTYTARRTCPYSSTPFIPPPSTLQAEGYLVLEFYSGAAGLSGRFTEGFSLRRLHGHAANRKRVQRLMQRMGLVAIYQHPRTSRPGTRAFSGSHSRRLGGSRNPCSGRYGRLLLPMTHYALLLF